MRGKMRTRARNKKLFAVAFLALTAGVAASESQPPDPNCKRTELIRRIESIWPARLRGKKPKRWVDVDWFRNPPKPRLAFQRLPGGPLVVEGTDREAVEAIRDINERPLFYLPVIEGLVEEAKSARRLADLWRLKLLLSPIIDSPRARADIARLFLFYNQLVERLPLEMSSQRDARLWGERLDIVDWRGGLSLDQEKTVWTEAMRSDITLLNQLADWRWRGHVVQAAALRILKEVPSEPKGHSSGVKHVPRWIWKRMEMALRYLALTYPGDDDVRAAVEDACRDPRSALNRTGYCQTEGGQMKVADALRKLGR